MTGAAIFRYSGGGIPLSFMMQSRAFDFRDAAAILPVLRTFNPAGTGSLALAGRGDLEDPASIQWRGNISLTNVSLKPSADVKPLKGLTGNALFKGSSMETSMLKARIGESDIQGSFRIDDFRKPRVVCQFNTSLLRTKDMGYQNPEGEVNFRNVKGQIAVEDKLIHADNLSFSLGKSSFNLSGDVSDLAVPKITVVLTSPFIHSDDFDRLISLKNPPKEGGTSSSMELNATLKVDGGKFRDVDFKNLNAGLKFTRGVLDVEKLEAGFFDGKLKAKGKVSIHPDGQNNYEANITINRVSLEKLQSYLEIGNRTVSGKLSLTGNLSATGRNTEDFKKTVAGTFKVQAEKGVLKKFSVLSKIFSLLNVLQLAKLHLPDVTTEGMPYKTITSDISTVIPYRFRGRVKLIFSKRNLI
jgi:uncharacterized protein YhdP